MQRQRLLYGAVTVFLLLASVVGLTLAQEADTAPATQRAVPVGMGFTYQGRLDHDGEPVDGECAMAFRLYDAADGIQVGEALTKTVTLSGGLFTQQLDFGDNVFAGDARWLGIEVKCSTDADFVHLGRQELTGVPYAHYARSTGALQGYPLATTDPVAGQVLGWDGAAWGPASIQDTTYGAGFGLTLDEQNFAVVTDTVQARVISACGEHYAIGQINADGSIICVPVGTGDITGVYAGPGLTGGGSTGEVTLTVALSGTGTADYVARSDHNHDGVYAAVAHTHTGDEIIGPVAEALTAVEAITATYSTNAGHALTSDNAGLLDGNEASHFAPAHHTHSGMMVNAYRAQIFGHAAHDLYYTTSNEYLRVPNTRSAQHDQFPAPAPGTQRWYRLEVSFAVAHDQQIHLRMRDGTNNIIAWEHGFTGGYAPNTWWSWATTPRFTRHRPWNRQHDLEMRAAASGAYLGSVWLIAEDIVP